VNITSHLASFVKSAVFTVAVCGVAWGCMPKAPNYDYAKEPNPTKTELVLGVGDELRINVWENPNLSTDVIIRADGTITMPLVGDMKAAGETPTALKVKIKAKVGDFVKLQGSEVTVAVKSWKSYRFTISGEVTRAGVFGSDQYVTVSDAVALAGGFTRFARRDEIVLMRRDTKSGEMRSIPLSYDLLASGQRPDMNIYVLPGDSIYVP
jgi:polysaccharide biosynthesis/export protein